MPSLAQESLMARL